MSEASNEGARIGAAVRGRGDAMTATTRCLFAAASMILCTSTAIAEPTASPQVQLPTTPQPSVSQPKIDDVALAILIKSAIIAAQHANATGNYSVLRDL